MSAETAEMVERVARAIAHSDGGRMVGNSQSKATREFGWDANHHYIDKYIEAHWTKFRNAACFAIEAMREPTAAMLEVGPPEPYMDAGVWAKMIDMALTASPFPHKD